MDRQSQVNTQICQQTDANKRTNWVVFTLVNAVAVFSFYYSGHILNLYTLSPKSICIHVPGQWNGNFNPCCSQLGQTKHFADKIILALLCIRKLFLELLLGCIVKGFAHPFWNRNNPGDTFSELWRTHLRYFIIYFELTG